MNLKQKLETVDTVHTHTHTHTGNFTKNEKRNICLIDCEEEEIKLFIKGIEEKTNLKFDIKSAKCNGKRNLLFNLYRYMVYIFYPIKFFIRSKKI